MANERPEAPRVRLFVALDLPDATRDEITAWGERELSDSALRPVPRESLHITLARLFALPADSPATVALQGELARRLVAERLYKPEKRPFWPHVTVARVKGTRRRQRVDRQPGELPRQLLLPIQCVRLTLYRSELQPLGARYAPLAQVKLSRTGGSEVKTWQTKKRL